MLQLNNLPLQGFLVAPWSYSVYSCVITPEVSLGSKSKKRPSVNNISVAPVPLPLLWSALGIRRWQERKNKISADGCRLIFLRRHEIQLFRFARQGIKSDKGCGLWLDGRYFEIQHLNYFNLKKLQ